MSGVVMPLFVHLSVVPPMVLTEFDGEGVPEFRSTGFYKNKEILKIFDP